MADGLTPFRSATSIAGRRAALWLLVLGVAAVHGCVGRQVAEGLADAGEAASAPPRIEVAYVREMAPSASPPSARAAAPMAARQARRSRPKPAAPARPASAAEEAPEPAVVAAASPEPSASMVAEAAVADAPASAASAADLLASAAPASSPSVDPATDPTADAALAGYDWPVSTRVTYTLTGNYRGAVNGSANVEWIRVGTHYQVHLDLLVGPSFAPVITRRMTSDGEIDANGLSPRRYDQQTRVMGSNRNPATLRFEQGVVVLANGDRMPSVPGVQDTASQFIQLTYVFGTRPALLQVGGTVDIPLALPHKVDVWTYDVVAEETITTPFGELAAIHLKPRRKSDKANELTAEIWFAPSLRYLPARIRIEQGGDNFIDMVIDRRPEMAGS